MGSFDDVTPRPALYSLCAVTGKGKGKNLMRQNYSRYRIFGVFARISARFDKRGNNPRSAIRPQCPRKILIENDYSLPAKITPHSSIIHPP
jgi:hypothetical protein